MKKIILLLLLSLALPVSLLAKVSSLEETLKKMNSYQENSLLTAGEKALSEEDLKKQDLVYDTLREAVDLLIKNPKAEELNKELLRVSVLMLKKDPTQYAGEILLPLYQKDRKSFLNSLKGLSKDQAQKIEEAVKDSEKEALEGNG